MPSMRSRDSEDPSQLVVDDEEGIEAAQGLWLDSDYLVCAEIATSKGEQPLPPPTEVGSSTRKHSKSPRPNSMTSGPRSTWSR